MSDEQKRSEIKTDDLRKVEQSAAAKQMRHRADEYLAIVLGVGAVLLLWLLQAVGLY